MAGVFIVINTKPQGHIQSYETINERLIPLDLLLMRHKIIIIWVYTPIDDANPTEKDQFFENLVTVLDKIGNSNKMVIMGDFNGRVGRQIGNKIVEKHGENFFMTMG